MFESSPNKATSFKKVSFLPLCIAFSLALFLSASIPSEAQTVEKPVCLLDGFGTHGKVPDNCPTELDPFGLGGTTNAATGTAAARVNPQHIAETPIDPLLPDLYRCRYIDNTGNLSYFAPWGSKKEWSDFTYNDTRDSLSFVHCARPFPQTKENLDPSKGLFFGPTSAKPVGEGDFPIYPVTNLPYWRTGKSWPGGESTVTTGGDIDCCPWWGCQKITESGSNVAVQKVTHVFNHHCQAPYPEYHCFEETTCCSSSVTGQNCVGTVCTDIVTESCSPCCARSGTVCNSRRLDWSETFDFSAIALDSDNKNPSWQGQGSQCIAGRKRPLECYVECHQEGESCICEDTPDKPPVNSPLHCYN